MSSGLIVEVRKFLFLQGNRKGHGTGIMKRFLSRKGTRSPFPTPFSCLLLTATEERFVFVPFSKRTWGALSTIPRKYTGDFLLPVLFLPPSGSSPRNTPRDCKNLQDMNYGLWQYLVFFQVCFGSLTSLWKKRNLFWARCRNRFSNCATSWSIWKPTWRMPCLFLTQQQT